jgi:CBS domain-containing protein
MVEEHAHQLFIVDARQRPVGIITITDMLRKLTGWQPSSAALDVDLEEEEVEQQKADSGHGMGVESGEELVEMKRVVSAVQTFPPAGAS